MDSLIARSRLETAVVAAMDDAAKHPMQWGVDDCGLWFANMIRDALGYDPAADLRIGYRDREGARKALGPLGLAFALRTVAKRYGWHRIAPQDASPGDVGLILIGGNLSTVICRKRGWFVGRNENGFTALADHAVRLAWAVI